MCTTVWTFPKMNKEAHLKILPINNVANFMVKSRRTTGVVVQCGESAIEMKMGLFIRSRHYVPSTNECVEAHRLCKGNGFI